MNYMKKVQHHHIIEQVPVDYYQKGISANVLQRLWHTNKLKKVLELIPSSSHPKKILDVGCASGWFIAQIAERFPNAKCYGIDLYGNAIHYAKLLYPFMEFKVADAHRIPYKASTIDIVVCTEVLEHVNDPKQVLRQIYRVLKKNGTAIIELDSGSPLFAVSWYLWRKFNGYVWNDSHLHSFNIRKLDRMMRDCKFKIKKKSTFNLGMAIIFEAIK